MENGIIVLDNFVKFTQNLYNSQSYVDTIAATDFDDITSQNNTISSLQFLWKLCTSFTPLVKGQIPEVARNIAALAFAIYSIKQYDNGLIIDEAQNLPEIFSYIQLYVDKRNTSGQYLLTGSQNFLLNEKISQSLTGRVGILELLPLSFNEIAQKHQISTDDTILNGGYSRTYQNNI